MSDLYRRCGCRRPDGHPYPPLPEHFRTDADQSKREAATCPLLVADARHGSWGFSVSGTEPGSGRRIFVRRMGLGKREAIRERAKAVEELAAGRVRLDARMRLEEWFPRWLDRRVEDGLRPSSERMYRRYVEQDLVPLLGKIRLADLRRHHVDKFVRDLTGAGRGATTVRRIHATLSSALTAAQKLDLLQVNPALKVTLPNPEATPRAVWELEQLGTFLDTVAAQHRLGVLFEVAVFTGLRRGELAGLKWEDVDLERNELIVRQQRVQLGATVVEGKPKTRSGTDRRLSLPSGAAAALVAWRISQDTERELWGAAGLHTGYVFTRENGEPLRPAYISRLFERLVEQSGLPYLSLHDLRHLQASLVVQATEGNMALVSKRMGHSNYAFTVDRYSHLLRSADAELAEAAEALVPRHVHTVCTPGSGSTSREVVQTDGRPALP